MAMKHAPSDTHDPLGLTQLSPSLSLADELLCSSIPLPRQPCIVYSVYTPVPACISRLHDSLELARRKVLDRNRSQPLLESWFSSVLVKRNPALYVYSIVSQDQSAQRQSEFNACTFDGLQGEPTPFTPENAVFVNPKLGFVH
jgi:hypothetical protein